MEEIWKEIEGFNGKYEISNFGRLKSYGQKKNGRIIDGYLNKKGYLWVRLYYAPQKSKCYSIHRLVANAFIPNPDGLPQINHKDECKENNRWDNLEWCTNEYNYNYGTRIQRVTEKNRCCKTTSKKVYSVDEYGNINHYESIGEAERITGILHSNIVPVLKGRREKTHGLKWYYEDSQITNND